MAGNGRRHPRRPTPVADVSAQRESTMSVPKNKVPFNLPVASIDKIKAEMGPPPWSQVLVGWERMTGTLICQAPGQGNNGHHHPEPEWWVIVEGELEWRMDDRPPVRVKAVESRPAPRACTRPRLWLDESTLDPPSHSARKE